MLVLVPLGWAVVLHSPALQQRLGYGATGRFFDWAGSLAAGEAAARGLDPYAVNPLDPFGRAHLYSSWWLVTGRLGLTRADSQWTGLILTAALFTTVVMVWRPRNWPECGAALVILLSPAWLLAVYRGNNDTVIFVLLAVATAGWQRGSIVTQGASSALLGALAILKYFPIAGVIGIAETPSRGRAIVLLAATAVVLGLGWSSLDRALTTVAQHGPQTRGLQSFGAAVLPSALPETVAPPFAWLLGAAAGAAGVLLARNRRALAAAPSLGVAVASAVVLAAFLAGTSFNYKLIFLWSVVPWLMREGAAGLGRGAWVLLLLIGAECWIDGLTVGVINTFSPVWSRDARMLSLQVIHAVNAVTQIGCWVLMGACGHLAWSWLRHRLRILAT